MDKETKQKLAKEIMEISKYIKNIDFQHKFAGEIMDALVPDVINGHKKDEVVNALMSAALIVMIGGESEDYDFLASAANYCKIHANVIFDGYVMQFKLAQFMDLKEQKEKLTTPNS